MPSPQSMEDAISLLLQHNPGMGRGDAVNHISQMASSGDKRYTSIPNLQEDMGAEQTKAFFRDALLTGLHATTAIPRAAASYAANLLPENAKQNIQSVLDETGYDWRKYVPPAEKATESPLGQAAGTVGAFMVPDVPGEALGGLSKIPGVGKFVPAAEEGAEGALKGSKAWSGPGQLIDPLLNKAKILGQGKGLVSKVARGAAEGALMGKAGVFGYDPMQIPFTGYTGSPAAANAVFGGIGGGLGGALEKVLGRVAGTGAAAAEADAGAKASPFERGAALATEAGAEGAGTARPAPEAPPTSQEPLLPRSPFGGPQIAVGSNLGEQYMRQMEQAKQTDLFAGMMPPSHSGPTEEEIRMAGGLMPTEGEAAGPFGGPSLAQPPPPIDPEAAWFRRAPAEAGFLKSPEEKLAERFGEPAPDVPIVPGQPTTIDRYSELEGQRPGLKVYAHPESLMGKGASKVGSVVLKKPMVVNVRSVGQQGFVDAAKAMWGTQAVSDALDRSANPVSLAQELIARAAKRAGFDSVALKGEGALEDNLVLDLQDWKQSKHPEIDAKLSRQMNLKPAVRGRPAAPEIKSPFAATPAQSLMQEQLDPMQGLKAESGGGLGQAFDRNQYLKDIAGAKAEEAAARDARPFDLDAEQQDTADHANAVAFDDVSRMAPEIQRAMVQVNEASLNGLTRFRPIAYAMDHPLWQGFLQRVVKTVGQLESFKKGLGGDLEKVFKGLKDTKKFDDTIYAFSGLRYDAKGNVVQTLLDADPKLHQTSLKIFESLGKAYTLLTGVDAKVPWLMERFNLAHDRPQFMRLKAIQEGGPMLDAMVASKRPPTSAEGIVADATKGMLNFDDSHDLNIVPWKGFLSFYPAENEEARINDAIMSLRKQATSGYASPDSAAYIAQMEKYKARLNYLGEQAKRDAERAYPRSDNIPKYKHFNPIAAASSPAARPLFFDMDVPRVVSKFLLGVVDKRQSDIVLDGARNLLRHPDFQRADVKQYITDYANTVRGARGYAGDRKFADAFNSVFGSWHQTSAAEMHQTTSRIMDWMSQTRLFASPVRMPIINMTHLLVTLMPVSGFETFARAVGDIMSNPQKWYAAAAEDGAIRSESDFLREAGDPKTVSTWGQFRKGTHALTYMTENFRRAVAYRAGLLTDEKDWSPLVRSFTKEGHASPLDARRAYARGLVSTTQFETSLINKPLAFTGSPMRRLASQFRTWPSNLSSLYWDMVMKKQGGALARGMGALWFFGGLAAMTPGGQTVYDVMRDHFLRRGVNLPEDSGAEQIAHTLGFQGTPYDAVIGMNLHSLHDPFALVPSNLGDIAGPTIGTAIDVGKQIGTAVDSEDYNKLGAIALSTISPQLRALAGAAVDYTNVKDPNWMHDSKVFGPSGALEMTRPFMATVMRGLDLDPSPRSIHYADQHDMASAVESGNQKLVMDLREKALRDGVVMDGRFWRGVNEIVKRRQKPLSARTSKGFWQAF